MAAVICDPTKGTWSFATRNGSDLCILNKLDVMKLILNIEMLKHV